MTVDGEILRVTISYSAPGASTGQTVHHYIHDGPGLSDGFTLDAIENWADLDWGEEWGDLASAQAALSSFDCVVVDNLGNVVRDVGSRVIGRPGGAAGEVLPSANAGLMTANTAFPKQRGRKFPPYIAEIQVENGLLTAAALTALTELFQTYVQDIIVIVGTRLVAGVLSNVRNEFVPFVGTGVVTDVPAYQRRRKPSVGI